MKILYVLNSLNHGGAEKVVSDLSNSLISKNHDVEIISIFGNDISFYLNPKVKVKLLKYNFGILGIFKSFFHICFLVLKSKPQIIHSHLLIPNLLTRIISIFFKNIVIINSAHSLSENYSLSFFIYRITHPLVDLFTNVSDAATNSFIKKIGFKKNNQIIRMYNGIDCNIYKRDPFFYKKRNNKLNLIAIGSLNNSYKDFSTLIKAFKLIQDKIPYANLKLIGDGPDRNTLEKLCENLNLDKSIFLGSRNDVASLLKESDILISSSKIESFGINIVEAMSSSVLVVATKSEGAIEVLRETGRLVSIGDHVGIFKEVINLHNLKFEEKLKIVKSARQRALINFNLNQIVNQWINHYSNLLKKNKI